MALGGAAGAMVDLGPGPGEGPAAVGGQGWRRPARALRRGGRGLLDLLLPPQCLRCRAAVDVPGRLCAECWREVDFLGPPLCEGCGRPFDFHLGSAARCIACLRRPPSYGRARAVLRYDDASRGLILGFKHGDRTESAGAFGGWMARAGAELLREADLLVPVPLHRWRLLSRRYNQSALLARRLARISGVPYAPDLLRRLRATPSQGGLDARERRRNVRGAFGVAPGQGPRLAGLRVLLIDDVLTTGATVEACARCLLAAGAGGVDVLTLARVVRPESDRL